MHGEMSYLLPSGCYHPISGCHHVLLTYIIAKAFQLVSLHSALLSSCLFFLQYSDCFYLKMEIRSYCLNSPNACQLAEKKIKSSYGGLPSWHCWGPHLFSDLTSALPSSRNCQCRTQIPRVPRGYCGHCPRL